MKTDSPHKRGRYGEHLNASDNGTVAGKLRAGQRYEARLVQLFEHYIKPGDIVLDIGANFGYFTIRFSKLVGSTGRVFAFEPDPANRALLERNIDTNGCRNVTIIADAVSDQLGSTAFYLDSYAFGVHSLAKDNLIVQGQSLTVNTTTLDDFVREHEIQVNAIKIDAQGAEGRILSKAGSILSRERIFLTLEFWPEGLRSLGSEPESLLKLLKDYGMNVSLISSKKALTPMSDAELHSKLLNRQYGKYSSTNIAAWRGSL